MAAHQPRFPRPADLPSSPAGRRAKDDARMLPDRPVTVTLTPDQVSAIDCALTDRRHALAAALAEHPEAVTLHDVMWTAAEERLVDQVEAVLHAAVAAVPPTRREKRAARREAQPAAVAAPYYSAPVLPREPEVH
jgi:hypothetical protein